MNNFEYQTIEKAIGYTFKDKKLLFNAFVHSSYANEHNIADNERMEFLGDAILDYIVSRHLYDNNPNMDAGAMSKARANVVSATGLKVVVKRLGIMQHLMMSGNAQKSASQSKKMEANLYEAIVCAIYYDGGIEQADAFITRTIGASIPQIYQAHSEDYKSRLQELCHRKRMDIEYILIDRYGPDNNPIFVCGVVIDGQTVATGKGNNKKQAETQAAQIAYESMVRQ